MSGDIGVQKLCEAALAQGGLNIALSHAVQVSIDKFLQLRSQWASTHNLSGPKAHHDPWLIDVNDAVALGLVLRKGLPLYDVGSGSGIPGLLLKLMFPDQEIVLVEPLAKRVAFLKTAIHKFKLKGITVIRRRWPIDGVGNCQVVSRAVVSPETWPSLANCGTHVQSIYRYLARSRPDFRESEYVLGQSIDYQRSADEILKIERWDRMPQP